MFSDRYRIEDLKLSCTAERSIISTVSDFYKDDVNEEHSKIKQFLASSDLNSPTTNDILKLFVKNRTLVIYFCVYFGN